MQHATQLVFIKFLKLELIMSLRVKYYPFNYFVNIRESVLESESWRVFVWSRIFVWTNEISRILRYVAESWTFKSQNGEKSNNEQSKVNLG